MRVTVSETPGSGWDEFVREAGGTIYLRDGWNTLARDVFGHRVFFLEARAEADRLVGALAIVQQRGLLGNFATSMPFFNYGGAVTRDPEVAGALMDRARALAMERGCSYLELRDTAPRGPGWVVRTDKVNMILGLPADDVALGKQLGSKLRSQIKRADREGITVRSGGRELLDAFYDVFCRNMRDLGTPVYPRRFFAAILEKCAVDTRLVIIDHLGQPAAAGFLVFDGSRAEIPWAACRAEAKPLGVNMRLYWEVLRVAIARHCSAFDFGRSTIDSGTYKFKRQWGAQPLQLYWHRWERRARPPTTGEPGEGGESRLRRLASSVWQRLPLPVANLLGPRISPGLPW